MPARMTGKVVVITGGAAGIGRASAMAFAREGASVIIGDIDGAGAEETVSRIREGGGKATSVRTDVTNSADVRRMVQSAVEQHGGLDYAFNNAGFVGSSAGIVGTTEEEWHQAVALNLTSVWLCMKYEIPEMLKRGGGAIVNNGSVVGLVGSPLIVGRPAGADRTRVTIQGWRQPFKKARAARRRQRSPPAARVLPVLET